MAEGGPRRKVLSEEDETITVVMEVSTIDVVFENNDPTALQRHSIDNLVMTRIKKVVPK